MKGMFKLLPPIIKNGCTFESFLTINHSKHNLYGIFLQYFLKMTDISPSKLISFLIRVMKSLPTNSELYDALSEYTNLRNRRKLLPYIINAPIEAIEVVSNALYNFFIAYLKEHDSRLKNKHHYYRLQLELNKVTWKQVLYKCIDEICFRSVFLFVISELWEIGLYSIDECGIEHTYNALNSKQSIIFQTYPTEIRFLLTLRESELYSKGVFFTEISNEEDEHENGNIRFIRSNDFVPSTKSLYVKPVAIKGEENINADDDTAVVFRQNYRASMYRNIHIDEFMKNKNQKMYKTEITFKCMCTNSLSDANQYITECICSKCIYANSSSIASLNSKGDVVFKSKSVTMDILYPKIKDNYIQFLCMIDKRIKFTLEQGKYIINEANHRFICYTCNSVGYYSMHTSCRHYYICNQCSLNTKSVACNVCHKEANIETPFCKTLCNICRSHISPEYSHTCSKGHKICCNCRRLSHSSDANYCFICKDKTAYTDCHYGAKHSAFPVLSKIPYFCSYCLSSAAIIFPFKCSHFRFCSDCALRLRLHFKLDTCAVTYCKMERRSECDMLTL